MITVKLATENEPTHKTEFPQEVLYMTKRATKKYNRFFI